MFTSTQKAADNLYINVTEHCAAPEFSKKAITSFLKQNIPFPYLFTFLPTIVKPSQIRIKCIFFDGECFLEIK